MRTLALMATLVALLNTPALAQSLNVKAPAPLQAGLNTGTVDSLVGPHYYYVTAGPGPVHMRVSYTPMSLLGAAYRSTITATISDEARTWTTTKNLTSDRGQVEVNFDGTLKSREKQIITIKAPNNLVRTGGDYTIECSGAVSYGAASSSDPIVGMYHEMYGYVNELGDCKFAADGTIVTTNGGNGHWKVFDKDSSTYIVDIEGTPRKSLKLVPARGLLETGDAIVFQCK